MIGVELEIEFFLGGDGKCVQTVLRGIRDRAQKVLLSDDPGGDLEWAARTLELATDFLESADFNELRARRPELAGTREGSYSLRRGANGGFEIVESEGGDQTRP